MGLPGIPDLPLRVHPRPGEPAYALFARLARRMGAPSPNSFALELGLDHRDIRAGRATQLVARLSGDSQQDLASATFLVTAEGVRLNGEAMDRADWSCARPRACPSCIAEDISAGGEAVAWHRTWWDVLPLRRCPLHGVPLVPLSDGFLVLGHLGPHEGGPPPRADGERYVIGRLGLGTPVPSALLDGLPLSRAVELMRLMGGSADGRGWGTRERCRVDENDLLSAGFSVLSGGEASLRVHLDSLVRTAPVVRDQLSPNTVYGRLFALLASGDLDPAFQGIRDIVRDHAIANLPVPEGQSFLGAPIIRQAFYTYAQAAVRLEVEKPLAERLLAVTGTQPRRTNPLLEIVSGAEVARAAEFAAGTMWAGEARDLLGLTAAGLASVVKAGSLVPALNAKASGAREDRFFRADIERLLRSVLDGLRFVSRPPPGSAALSAAVKSAMSSTGEIVAAIVDGGIVPTGRLRRKTGLASVLVDTGDVFALRDTSCDEFVPWKDVVAALTDRSVAAALVAGGYFTCTTVPTGFRNRSRRVVPRREWTAFRARYVSPADFARERGTSAAAAARLLAGARIRPSIRGPADKLFYERRLLPPNPASSARQASRAGRTSSGRPAGSPTVGKRPRKAA